MVWLDAYAQRQEADGWQFKRSTSLVCRELAFTRDGTSLKLMAYFVVEQVAYRKQIMVNINSNGVKLFQFLFR